MACTNANSQMHYYRYLSINDLVICCTYRASEQCGGLLMRHPFCTYVITSGPLMPGYGVDPAI